MAGVGGAITLFVLCSLLLPVAIGTRAEQRQCAFSEHLQGATRDNSTVLCSRGRACFGLWEQQVGGELVLLKQGCWTSQPDCLSDLCLVTAPPAHISRGSYRFCCCSQDMCNRGFREAPGTPGPPVLQPTDGAPPGQRWALVAVGVVVGALTLASLLLCGYRLLTGKKKLNLVMVTVPETAGTCDEQLKMGELICRGRYTSVYRGALSERSVAVKVFPAAHRHKYDNERYNYSLLLPRQQLNIARFLCGDERVDAGGGVHFLLVLEHYPQGSLSHFLSRWSVDWPSCCRMMHGVSRGLSFLHSEVLTGDEWKPAMVHRDLSSSNVLLRSDLSCVLADFSLSKRLTREPCPQHGGPSTQHGDPRTQHGDPRTQHGDPRTQHGDPRTQHEDPRTQHGDPRTQHGDSMSEVGALRYLAPELVAGPLCECGAALKQADVYALGLLFWESFRRCHDLFPGGTSPHFQLAFEAELGREPTLQDMHRLVVRDRCRPRPPLQWRDSSSVLQQLKETMEECWDQDAEARLSAQCVEERLGQMSRLHVPATPTHSDGAGGRWPAEPSSCSVDVSEEQLSQVVMRPSSLQLLTTASPRGRPGGPRHASQHSHTRLETGPHRTRLETETGPHHTRLETETGPHHTRLETETGPHHNRLETERGPHHNRLETETGPHHTRLETETGPHHNRVETETGPHHNRVETGVAKMNSVEVLAQAPLSVTMATNRRAVLRMANGCTAGVPTVVTNRLIVGGGVTNRLMLGGGVTNRLMVGGGVTNPAGPEEEEEEEEEEEACSSSAGGASQSTMALNFLWSPDDRQPLLHREVPPAGVLLSAPNTNNNNSNLQSCRCSSEGGPGLRPVLDPAPDPAPDPAYAPASQGRPVHSQQGTCTKTPQSSNQHLEHTEVTSEGVNFAAASSDPALSWSAAPVPDSDRDLPLSSAPALVQDPQTLAQRFADAADGHWCKDTDRSRPVSSDLRSAPDRDHRLPRPCSLDLSSSSALDGADQSDSGLSVAGEKIRRRVKTPYTVKKWRPASWAPPSDQYPDLQLLASAFPTTVQSRSRMVQSRSSMAALVQRDTSKPDGITSF